MSTPVVNPQNARSAEYAEQLKQIQEEGKCPFCPGGYTLRSGQEILREEQGWVMMAAQPPLANTAVHLFVFPREHKEEMTELVTADWEAITALTKWAKNHFNMPAGV